MAQGLNRCCVAAKISHPTRHYLTEVNWQQVGIDALCFDLEALAFLPQQQAPSWHLFDESIHPWTGKTIVDLSAYRFHKPNITLVSPYNGQKHRVEWVQWLRDAIIHSSCLWIMPQLNKPNPFFDNWISELPAEKILFPTNESSEQTHLSVYGKRFISHDQHHPWFVLDTIIDETLEGQVFDGNECYTITDTQWTLSNQPLANTCSCEACQMALTRCYFHHLHQHVPLLSNRYLTNHNVSQICLHVVQS